MKTTLLIVTLIITGSIVAQVPPPINSAVIEPIAVELNPDTYPEFSGGSKAMNLFIMNNLDYPEKARENGDSGTVHLSFIVTTSGEITNIQVIRGGLTPELDAEAIRLFSIMPPWIPAVKNGTPVNAEVIMPLNFYLV